VANPSAEAGRQHGVGQQTIVKHLPKPAAVPSIPRAGCRTDDARSQAVIPAAQALALRPECDPATWAGGFYCVSRCILDGRTPSSEFGQSLHASVKHWSSVCRFRKRSEHSCRRTGGGRTYGRAFNAKHCDATIGEREGCRASDDTPADDYNSHAGSLMLVGDGWRPRTRGRCGGQSLEAM
jgi:hypothetical protein